MYKVGSGREAKVLPVLVTGNLLSVGDKRGRGEMHSMGNNKLGSSRVWSGL